MTNPVFKRKVKVAIRITIAAFFIVLGIIITPLPIPLGLMMIAFGLILIAYDNNRVIRHIRIIRRRFPGLSVKLTILENKNMGFVSDVLKQVNPANALSMPVAKTETDAKL